MPKPEMLTFLQNLNTNRCIDYMSDIDKVRFYHFCRRIFDPTFIKNNLLCYRNWEPRDDGRGMFFHRGRKNERSVDPNDIFLVDTQWRLERGPTFSRLHVHCDTSIISRKYPDLTVDINQDRVRRLYAHLFLQKCNYKITNRHKNPSLINRLYITKHDHDEDITGKVEKLAIELPEVTVEI